uniref:Kinesin-associated protein 3 n=1 Tax=Acrobeloides nanus TaxID=290746 RepID=A0A914CMF9_9BILA
MDSNGDLNDVDPSQVKHLEIDAHAFETAIVVKYEVEEEHSLENVGQRQCQKIIRLKDLNETVDVSALAHVVLDKCKIIPLQRIIEVEQVIFYLQKRLTTPNGNAIPTQNGVSSPSASRAKMDEIDSYIEMLYEDSEKTKATAYVLQLTQNLANLPELIENEILMGALTRVFREDSKKNFELATNIANIFLHFSQYSQFQSLISHYKIGALSMQLIEHELKRWDLWKEEAKTPVEKTRKKWEFAMKKQDQLITVCLQLLLNLAEDIKVENKMVKRGVIPMLIKCLDHMASENLILAAVTFLWKLSVFMENKDALAAGNIIEKLVELFPTNDLALSKALFSLFFNLSFDPILRNRMVVAGLVNFVAPFIEANKTAMNLLYQLSMVEDAKAMITFTDVITVLMLQIGRDISTNVTKGLLINIALEKRNAQLICSSDGQGLETLINLAIKNFDVLVMKIVRNIASHEGPIHEMFVKHLPKLLELAMQNCSSPKATNYAFGLECLGTAAQITTGDWAKVAGDTQLLPWISEKIQTSTAGQARLADDLLLQIVILCGSMTGQPDGARSVMKIVPDLIQLLTKKQEDDEIVLQIVYVFYGLLCYNDLNIRLCSGKGEVVEYLINLMHDKNPQLRSLCDQALQFIAETNEQWNKRIIEERFRWHNAQWIEMVSGGAETMSDLDIDDHFNNVVLDAEEILDEEDL